MADRNQICTAMQAQAKHKTFSGDTMCYLQGDNGHCDLLI